MTNLRGSFPSPFEAQDSDMKTEVWQYENMKNMSTFSPHPGRHSKREYHSELKISLTALGTLKKLSFHMPDRLSTSNSTHAT